MNKCRFAVKSLFFILLSMCSTTFAFEPIQTNMLMTKGHGECCCKGPWGHRGKKGKEGDRGIWGHRGHRGEEGDRGHHGKKGDEGDHRGKKGKKGHRGKKGHTGHRGSLNGPQGPTGPRGPNGTFGIGAFMSAYTLDFGVGAGTIGNGANILGFIFNSNVGVFVYNPINGVFTSNAGPGVYEISFGAIYTANTNLVLRVDGAEVNPLGNVNIQSNWVMESIIITSATTNPTFSIGNAGGSTSMILAGDGTGPSAFITIKKIS